MRAQARSRTSALREEMRRKRSNWSAIREKQPNANLFLPKMLLPVSQSVHPCRNSRKCCPSAANPAPSLIRRICCYHWFLLKRASRCSLKLISRNCGCHCSRLASSAAYPDPLVFGRSRARSPWSPPFSGWRGAPLSLQALLPRLHAPNEVLPGFLRFVHRDHLAQLRLLFILTEPQLRLITREIAKSRGARVTGRLPGAPGPEVQVAPISARITLRERVHGIEIEWPVPVCSLDLIVLLGAKVVTATLCRDIRVTWAHLVYRRFGGRQRGRAKRSGQPSPLHTLSPKGC